ncbi:MAG: sigma-70 family RNA polymerase sigma factor [Lachnospira sp.]|nr:sigma-70 family RNA polymerase sigma factor [Lachnospira sp.]
MNITSRLRAAIESYKNGDENAFATIYEESKGYIYSSISNALSAENRNEDFIQDIMQDTYLDISKDICKLENVDSFLSWASTIANRKTYATIKKNGKYVLLGEDESFENLEDTNNRIPEDVVVDKEKQEMVREVINTELTEDERDCVVGYYYNDMKQKEIAEQLEMPQNTVASNIFRAKSKLRKALGGVFVVAVAASIVILLLNVPAVKEAINIKGKKERPTAEFRTETPTEAHSEAQNVYYYVAATGESISDESKFPSSPSIGDKYISGDYMYTFEYSGIGCNTWIVGVREHNKSSYGEILSTILNEDVKDMSSTFSDCTNMKYAPDIPDTVENMFATFKNCKNLKKVGTIPENVKEMRETFLGCTSLAGNVVINATPVFYEECFKGVKIVAQGIKLSGSSTLLSELRDTAEFEKIVPEGATYYVASENKMLQAGGELPDYTREGDKYITNDYEYTYMNLDLDHFCMGWEVKVKDNTKEKYEDFLNNIGWLGLRGTFEDCTNMKESPKLTESVVLLERTFAGCTSLEKAPVIPEGIQVLKETFAGCISLEKAPVIPESVVELDGTFKGCTALVEAPIISKKVVCLYETFSGCTSLTGTIEINAKLIAYDKCFYGLDFAAQNITLQGTSDKLADLMNTVNEIPSNPNVVEYGDTIRVSWRSMYTGGSWTEDRDKWIDRGEKEFVVKSDSYEFSSDVLGGYYSDLWENINNSLGKKVGETFETYQVGTDGAMRYEFTILEILKS